MKSPRSFLLSLIILLGYIPFLGFRLIRPTGDEKVYIAQALEMADRGFWFVQTLAGEPAYFKGPLHYVLLRVGHLVFGDSLWTALYMNLAFILLGAVFLAAIIREAFPKRPHWPLWGAVFFAFNTGVFGHALASQMEAELVGIFSLGFWLLWKDQGHAKATRYGLGFWMVAGVAGWLKSPLHSVLLAGSGLLFWALEGTLFARLKNPRFYLQGVVGVVTGIIGYLPAAILDTANFMQTYVQKETLQKASNGGPVWQSILPMMSYYLIPWMGIALCSYLEGLVSFKDWIKKTTQSTARSPFLSLIRSIRLSPVLKLGIAGILPSFIFFAAHPYRGENYALPVISSVILILLTLLEPAGRRRLQVRKLTLGLLSLLVLVIPVSFQLLDQRIGLPQTWWPSWALPSMWILALMSAGLSLRETFTRGADGMGLASTISQVAFMWVLAIPLAVLGEMEVVQLKNQISLDRQQGRISTISYWNLNHLIWNEWGLMELAVHEPIRPLLKESDLIAAIGNGDLILARDTDQKRTIDESARRHYPNVQPVTYDWHRWKTHPYAQLKLAWEQKDISVLYDHALMVRYLPSRDPV